MPRSGEPSTTSRPLRAATSSSCRPAQRSSCRRGWRTSSGTCSPTPRLACRSTARSGSSRVRGRAARSSSSRRRRSALDQDRRLAGGDRGRLPVGRVGQARTRGGVRRAGGPGRVRGPRRSSVDAVRPCAPRPAAVRVARRRAAGAVRAPSLAVLGARSARTSTGSKEGSGAGASSAATARPRSPCSFATGGRCRRSISPWTRCLPSPLSERWRTRCCAARTARRLRRSDLARSRTSGRTTRSHGRSTSSRRSRDSGTTIGRADVLATLERATVRGDGTGAPGRVAVLDLMRARTRRFDTVFVLGLEQGSLPRRPRVEPFLDEDARRVLDERRGARLVRPDAASRDRFLFATACSRPRRRLVLVRQAVGDEGSPREPSPFWEAVRELFDEDDVRRHTTRRPLSALTSELEAAPTERERLRALAGLSARAPGEAAALARENGWDRRLSRATRAFDRQTRVSHERAVRLLGQGVVLGLRARADGVVLVGVVRRALPAPGHDRQADRPHAAWLDPACRAPALLPAASERDPGRRPRHGGERRGGRRPDARRASSTPSRRGSASTRATSTAVSWSRVSSATSSSS